MRHLRGMDQGLRFGANTNAAHVDLNGSLPEALVLRSEVSKVMDRLFTQGFEIGLLRPLHGLNSSDYDRKCVLFNKEGVIVSFSNRTYDGQVDAGVMALNWRSDNLKTSGRAEDFERYFRRTGVDILKRSTFGAEDVRAVVVPFVRGENFLRRVFPALEVLRRYGELVTPWSVLPEEPAARYPLLSAAEIGGLEPEMRHEENAARLKQSARNLKKILKYY